MHSDQISITVPGNVSKQIQLSTQFDSNVANWCMEMCEDDKKRNTARG